VLVGSRKPTPADPHRSQKTYLGDPGCPQGAVDAMPRTDTLAMCLIGRDTRGAETHLGA